MDQPVAWTDDMNLTFEQWCFQETDLIEQKKQALRKEKREIERERRKLEREQQLFEMKWKILEEELRKVADEKLQVEKQRKFYQYVTEHEERATNETSGRIVRGDLFFVGVEDKQALKKRYKDLLKIYHPDNVSGDVGTIQEINREYDKLQEKYR